MEWDPQAAVTPMGQLPFFIEFLKTAELFEPWVADCPLQWASPNAPSKPDILGFNFYPDFRFGWSNSREARRRDFTRNGTVPLEQAAKDAVGLVTPGIKQAQAYFDLPVSLTETSGGLSLDARIAYINALGRWVQQMRDEDLPLKGVNWWPLFDTIQWDYREKPNQPLKDFIYKGGWNNGLYGIDVEPDGNLKRVWTPAADAYRAVIERDLRR